MRQHDVTRRNFLKTTAAAGTFLPYFSWSEKGFANESKNDRPRIAHIKQRASFRFHCKAWRMRRSPAYCGRCARARSAAPAR